MSPESRNNVDATTRGLVMHRLVSIPIAFFLAIVFFLCSNVSAQSSQSSSGSPVLTPSAPAEFAVAPSISLTYAPTSIASAHLKPGAEVDLVTADYDAGTVTVFKGLGQGSFASGVAYAAGAGPNSLTIADIDGDGYPDVVVANESGAINVLKGNGDGTLAPRKEYAVGLTLSFLAVGNFSGSGKPDVVVASTTGMAFALLTNDGTGILGNPLVYSLQSAPTAIASGDFNGDGHLDLAIANASGTVSILLGSGDGHFSKVSDLVVAASAISAIVAADFNRDGNDDLAVTLTAQNKVAVLLSKGNGTFASPSFFGVGGSPVAAQVADVNHDGIPDLVVINTDSNTFSILNGVGDGTFKSAVHFVVGNTPVSSVVGSFYGSANLDLATIDQSSRTISIPNGYGDGRFHASRAYKAGVQPVALASGDLNGDGNVDLVVASYCEPDQTCGSDGNVAVLLSDPAEEYRLSSTYTMGAGIVAIKLVDVNGDKQLDMVALNRPDKTLSIRLGAGDGTFGDLITIPLSASPTAVALADFNKDGNIDLAVLEDCGSASCSTPGAVEFLAGSGDGNFQSVSTYTVGYSPVALAAGKISASGNDDLVIANRCGGDSSCTSSTATLLFGDGTGAFKAGSDVALDNSPASLALADLQGQGVLNLVFSYSNKNAVAVMTGNGDGSFQAGVLYPVGNAPGALAIADYNGDGIPDVAVANTADATVSVLFGNRDGTLQKSFAMPVSSNPTGIAAIAGPTSSAPASLATTSGSASTPLAVSNVTIVPNLNPTPMAVNPGSVTLSVLPSGPLTVNESVNLSVKVAASGGNGTPTGNVQFQFSTDAGATFNDLSDCGGTTGLAVDGTGAVACTSQQIPANASEVLRAFYLGEGTVYNSAASNQVTRVVARASTTVELTPLPVAPTINQLITLTATLSPTIAPAVVTDTQTISGTVVFNDATTTLCAAANVYFEPSYGTASLTCQVPVLSIGTHSLQAVYSGDVNYINSNGALSLRVVPATPIVSMIASPASPSPVNTSVTFTASLTGVPLTPVTPSGTMTFAVNGTTVSSCTHTVSGTGQATCTLNNLPPGSNTMTATYSGDTNFVAAAPGSAIYTINKASPTVSVTDSPAGTSALNTSVTFTATVSGVPFTPSAPTGTVLFAAGGTTITACATQVLAASGANYIATCTTSSVAAGNNVPITATYSGDTNFNSVTSAALPHTVTPLTPTVTVTDNPAGATPLNSPVTFTATLTPPAGNSLTPNAPSGMVGFTANGTAISGCTAQPVSGTSPYIATCTTSVVGAGTNIPIVVTYTPGSPNYLSSTSVSLPHTITKLTGTLATASSAGTSPTVGTSVTFTVTLTVSPVTPIAPTGNISFTFNGVANPLCPAVTINSSQQATCTTSGIAAGNYLISASYAGDSNFNAATAPTINLTENKANPTVSLTASSATAPPVVNEPVTFTAVVTNPAGISQPIQPSGTVTFTQGATTLCANAVLNTATAPQAICTYAFPSPVAAPGTVTATYNDDTNFNTGTAGTTSGTVNAATTTTTIASSGTVSVGQAITFTTTIVPQYSGTSIPQGTVTFSTNASPAPTGSCTTPLTVASNGNVPSCTFIFTTSGPFNVSATYTSSNSNFSSSASNTVVQAVNPGTLGINLTSAANPTSVNQPVTFSAAFTPSIPTPTPSGTVTYSDNGTTLCAVTVSPTGTIPDCTFTFMSAGSHAILASIPANASYQAASSNTLTQVVNQNKATPILNWPTPAAIVYGTALSATQLNATANTAGTFTYTPAAGTVLGAGVQALTVNFTPTDSADYTTATATTTLIVNEAGPVITWPSPAAIIYGTALSTTQLNATANVPGTFAYTPAGGSVLQPGSGQISVTFTPSDTKDYTTATKTVQISVLFRVGVACTNGMMSGVILQPINVDGSSVFKMGSTVPTKFVVCDVNNKSVGPNSAFPNSSVVAGYILAGATTGTQTGVDEVVYSNTPDLAFRWDSGAQQWIFNEATGTSTNLNAAPATYLFQIKLIDGTILGTVPMINNAGVPNTFGGQPGFQYGLR
jgi:Bacterial Ig-like domain (group 3)/FG-GAP-like repeat